MHCPMTGLICPNCMLECRKVKDGPPAEVLAVVDKVNDRIHTGQVTARAEAYLQYDSEGPDEWRIKIVIDGTLQITNLIPDKLYPHTVMLLIEGLRQWGAIQFSKGKEAAVNKVRDKLMEIIK